MPTLENQLMTTETMGTMMMMMKRQVEQSRVRFVEFVVHMLQTTKRCDQHREREQRLVDRSGWRVSDENIRQNQTHSAWLTGKASQHDCKNNEMWWRAEGNALRSARQRRDASLLARSRIEPKSNQMLTTMTKNGMKFDRSQLVLRRPKTLKHSFHDQDEIVR
jgi:hypothetical protein